MGTCELHEDRNCDEEAAMFISFGHYSALNMVLLAHAQETPVKQRT